MCGIAGFFSRTPVAAATADAMLLELARRGPDAAHQLRLDQHGQRAADAFSQAYRQGDSALAEQVLQLLILDESLQQLDALRRALP
ncbi:hypothetical protein [Aquitalea magnusonii]|uniref:Glutamine amidotransferase type-2 domain-containing protein n=1 Tax=Aquitalea magnusonii TaxID=332411 RepID=A0A318JBE2_9NEIS|nr:hypothetical protein [Aquitalea magnusonii]PXX45981.1 hypothetical protein DFR38_11079 [Aquitalea magnusonii]